MVTHEILSLARLPVPPLSQGGVCRSRLLQQRTNKRKGTFLGVFCTVGRIPLSTHTPAGWKGVYLRAYGTVGTHL